MSNHDVILHTVGAAVAAGGSFTANYPAGKAADDYRGGSDHQIHGPVALFASRGDFSIALGAADFTVTLRADVALAGGSKIHVHLDAAALERGEAEAALHDSLTPIQALRVSLGKPAAAAANNIVASQAATLAGGLATGINGALASGGVATLDVPRNVVAAWTGVAVLTVTGTDEFGKVVRESSASGSAFTGKKAFKTITGVTVSANVTALTVGTGNALGLPLFLASAGEVVRELQDDAVAAAGTIVLGDTAAATATTGDVRGTYAPAVAPDGAKLYELLCLVRSAQYRGAAQY